MINFDGKKVAVIGAGIEGTSTLKYLSKYKTQTFLLEQKDEWKIDAETRKLTESLNTRLSFGKNYLDALEKFDVIFRSPSVRPDLPQLVQAKKSGALITSQTKLFFDLCKAPIIGITGTKGKGTTSSLLYEMLGVSGRKVFLAGNIGNPPLEVVEQITENSLVILELSSFQLIDLEKSPNIAVVLMVTSEHLDWHKNTDEYINAKKKIVENQNEKDTAVISNDYPMSKKIGEAANGQKYYFSTKSEIANGAYYKEGKIVLNTKDKIEQIDITGTSLLGMHNLQNICAAALVAKLLDLTKNEIEKGIVGFKGLPHRLEFVRQVNEVRYYNDSASTIPETAIAAINAFKQPKVLILGGSSKNSDFSTLGKVIVDSNVSTLILIGQEANRIKDVVASAGFSGLLVEGLRDMKEIVTKASEVAKTGEVVVLSPACASFGIFKNYQDRGEQFKKAVNGL